MAVLGQKYRTLATQSDKSEADKRNRRVFEEMFHIVKAAWTEDLLSYKGEFYEVPYPYDDGIRNWPILDWTRSRGAPGEIDSDGVIRGISVIPKPYQQPHPPIFMAFSLSESTIRWGAKENLISQINVSKPSEFTRLCKVYQNVAAENGRNFKLGEHIAAPRYVYLGDSYDEGYQKAERILGWEYAGYYNNFGVSEGFRNPEDPAEPKPLKFTSEQQATKRLVEHEYALVGTVDDVKRKIDSLSRCHADGELEWFTWQFDQGLMSLDESLNQMEIFATKIMPEFQG